MVRVFDHLVEEVVKPGFCVACGACVASCPVKCIKVKDELPVLTGVCINCGICERQCPEIIDPMTLQRSIFSGSARDELLGTYVHALSVEAEDTAVKARCQDGGAVTAILSALLDDGYIDGALMVGTGKEPWRPVVRVATTKKEIVECAGSKYSRAPLFLGLRDAVNFYYRERLAIVGTPCQIRASWRMTFSDPTNRHLGEAIKLRVGLFCGGVFWHNVLMDTVEKQAHIPLADVAKFDIKDGKFVIHNKNGHTQELDISAVRQRIDQPCKLCSDFAAELADISVGSAGSPPGSSTVLIRTPLGIEAFDRAKTHGGFRAVEIDRVNPGIEEARRAAKAKKSMATEELEAIRKMKKPLPVWMQERPQEQKKETAESLRDLYHREVVQS